MKTRKYRHFVGDFETTVYKKQVATEVWASASVELYTEDVSIFHSIDEQFEYFKSIKESVIVYYHNLKFDGSFWLPFLMQVMELKQAYEQIDKDKPDRVAWLAEKDMPNNSFKYSISDKGQWYTIIIKINDKFIEIRDSMKLLPFSVKKIGKSFKTKHKKLNMNYKGFRYAGCPITDEEKTYIANDVLVVKEALEIMFDEGHDKLTIGSCCLDEFKATLGKEDYDMYFPDTYALALDEEKYGYQNVGNYIRKSYHGAWCYVVKGKAKKRLKNGTTADVNSLYSSVMHSESGNKYPVGKPTFWTGNIIPDEALAKNKYYFVRVKTRFYLKKGMLPFLQIKHTFMYDGTEALESSDVYNPKDGKYYPNYIGLDGEIKDTRVELTLTMTDYELLKDHYELVDFEILDGCWFYAEVGIFDTYINKYKEIKLNSTGALRELAKLFLNNLYGKMASSTDSSFKIAYIKDNLSLGFKTVSEQNKKAGYIPVGSAITSYARDFTIRVAQKNYHGETERGFAYADTDSIHCDLKPNEIVGIKVHDKDFCCWKLESCWDVGYFTRQKTYIEHVIMENLETLKKPYYNVKCAGMSEKCKQLFIKSMQGKIIRGDTSCTKEEILFLTKRRQLEDFEIGLIVPGKLKPKRIKGGVLLVEEDYQMRP